MARKKPIDLGDDLESRLADFCEAHYGAPQARIIREALEAFIADQLSQETELRKRYDAAREKRLGLGTGNVRMLNRSSKPTST